jgi:cytochrome c-type biogenesis protein
MNTVNLTAWLNQVSGMSPVALAAVAVAGLLVGIAPSSLPLYSVVAGYVSGQVSSRAKGTLLSAGFALGQATVDASIGILFGFLGLLVVRTIARYLALTNLLLAVMLLILGLALVRKIHIVIPVLRPKARRVDSIVAAYGLGVLFGLATCPACTPMVLPVLGAAATAGSPWSGGLLLFVFGLARGIPLLLIGAAAGMVKHLSRLTPWVPAIERTGGILLLIAALFFFYQSMVFGGIAGSDN